MAGVRAVILDLGNVLMFHDNALLFRKLGERVGLSPDQVQGRLYGPLWEATNRGGLDSAGMRKEISRALGLPPMPDAEFDALWSCHFRRYEEMIPVVEGLVGRVKLLLLSNTNPIHAAYFKPRLPVLERFDAVLCSCEVGSAKPDREIYEEAVRRSGVPAGQAVFFDDISEYVEAAKAVGLQGRVFTTAEAFQRDLRSLGL